MAKPCPVTGKRKFHSSLDVILAYARHRARRHTRPYLCEFCGYWHASSQPKRGRTPA